MKNILFIFWAFVLPFFLNAQESAPFDFVITKWTQENGLPQNTVHDIIQTKDGYIWLATLGGLVRFDGINFTVFNRFNFPDMLSNRIVNLFEDSKARLWIGSETGLSLSENGNFKTFTDNDGFKTNNDVKINQDKNGIVWIFASPVFYKYENDHFYKQEIIEDAILQYKAYEGKADFFMPYENNIYAVIEDKVVSVKKDFLSSELYFNSVLEYPKGTVWATTDKFGLYRFTHDKTYKLTNADGIVNYPLDQLYLDSDGLIWITGEDGVNIIVNNKIFAITNEHGLPPGKVNVVRQDNEGNYWIGTNISGLAMLRKTIISNYGKNEGLNFDQVLSLCLRKNGNLLIGTNGGGIYKLDDNQISYSLLNKFITHKYVWSIFEDSQTRLWSNSSGLVYVNEKGRLNHTPSDKFDMYSTSAIYEDSKGAIWVGYRFGLLRYFENKFQRYSMEQGLSNNNVRCIFEDNRNNIWVGTVNGLNKISDGEIESFTSVPGLRDNYIRAIYQDKDSTMWFGIYGGGLVRLKQNKFFVFSTKNGLFDNVISHIIEDENGYFWMGCNRGIQRISRKELNDFADGKAASYFVYNYDESDGMISSETNGGFQPSAVKDDKGNIYFPTVKGVAVVHTGDIRINDKPPPVYIEKVLVEGEEKDINSIQISYDSSDVEIYYSILSYASPGKNQSKYILEGHDKDWVNAAGRHYARYTNLPPGEYTFKVIACNNDNVWNTKGASLTVSVLPPYWMTWWFRVIIFSAFLSIGPIIYYRRIKTLKIEKIRQQEFSQKLIESQEAERKKIAAELHDSLGQNLLIIKSKLKSGLDSYGEDESKNKIAAAKEFISQSIDEVRSISKDLSPHLLDQLGLTAALEIMIENVEESTGIKFNKKIENIDKEFDELTQVNIFRIIQESLNNIIKHSGADKVDLKINKTHKQICISIKDNGKGFDLEDEKIKKGFGLAGIRERTRIFGGELKFHTTLNKGTDLQVTIPLDKNE